MLILTAAQNTQPDYVALAIVLAIAVIVAIMAIRKSISMHSKKDVVVVEPIPEAVMQKPTAPGSAGQVKLHAVEPKTAAMLMAIVANKMDKPLNELCFISIREAD
ncbi:MAG: hypothetical protein IJB47_03140 [Oscillospiraceae bacterium]|nr:hypothetical protein [Oscillospiraceae bacterium]